MTEVIATKDLVKRYGRVLALRSLNLKINSGDCLGLLGPNGAGKSTLVKILCGLARPTRGRAYVNGAEPYRDRKAALWKVGCIVEEPTYYSNFDPVTLLRYHGKIRGMDGRALEKRIREVLELLGLSGRARDKVHKFSRGMRQRLSIAQALLHNPDILIMDEPGLGLDPQGTHDVRQLIADLSNDGKTIFLASHRLYEVQEMCEEVVIIDHGQLLARDKVKNLEKILGTPALEVELLAKPEPAQVRMIGELKPVKSVTADGRNLRIKLEETQAARADVLEFLVKKLGLRVISYRTPETSLEDIYLRLVGGRS